MAILEISLRPQTYSFYNQSSCIEDISPIKNASNKDLIDSILSKKYIDGNVILELKKELVFRYRNDIEQLKKSPESKDRLKIWTLSFHESLRFLAEKYCVEKCLGKHAVIKY